MKQEGAVSTLIGDLRYKEIVPSISYNALIAERVLARKDLDYMEIPLEYGMGTWQLPRVSSKDISPEDKVIIIRGSIHADEVAGALTILNYFDELIDYAHSRGIKLIIYPLANPSGNDRGTRYSIDKVASQGNNDFMRYRLRDGSISEDDLHADDDYESYVMSADPSLGLQLPIEALVFQKLIPEDMSLGHVVASVDLHQDYLTENLPPIAYHYAFGDLRKYWSIVEKIKQVVPVWANANIDAGYGEEVDESGKIVTAERKSKFPSDENGFVVRYDGSWSDYFYRIGVDLSITSETSGATPIDKACLVNWIWLTGMIDLAGKTE